MISLIRETITHWRSRNAPRMGAALSYYAMLSFIPLLFLLVLLASALFSKELVQGTLVTEISKIVGSGAAEYIDTILRTKAIQDATLVTTIVSIGVTLFGAVGVFNELDQDFDALWETPKVRKPHTSALAAIWGFVHKKLVVFSFVPLLMLLLVIVISITLFFAVLEQSAVMPAGLSLVAQIIAPLVLGTVLFAVVYRILPNRTLPWRIIWIGAGVTTVLFIIGNFLIVEYIALIVHTDAFGAAASLVGLLIWTYYSAQVFFFGVSFTYVYARRKGIIAVRDSSLSQSPQLQ